MLRLCAAAGRRLDLLQLPRSGFGQLALVPLGYLLLLLWLWAALPESQAQVPGLSEGLGYYFWIQPRPEHREDPTYMAVRDALGPLHCGN